MAIKLTQMKCPSCGANLEFEGIREKVFCTYCGTCIAVTDENHHEVVYRYVDEAAVAKEKTAVEKIKAQIKADDNNTLVILAILAFILIFSVGAGVLMLLL